MSTPNAEPIQVYLGFAGNNPAGPWCVCSLGVVEGRPYPYSRIVSGARTNFQAAWAAVALSIERLAGRPGVLNTTLQLLEQQASRHDWKGASDLDEEGRAAWRQCLTGDPVVRWTAMVHASRWVVEAQEIARRGFAQWRLDEQGKVIP